MRFNNYYQVVNLTIEGLMKTFVGDGFGEITAHYTRSVTTGCGGMPHPNSATLI